MKELTLRTATSLPLLHPCSTTLRLLTVFWRLDVHAGHSQVIHTLSGDMSCVCLQDALMPSSEGCSPAGNVGGTSWQGQKTVFQDGVHASEGASEGAPEEVQPPANGQDHDTAGKFEKVKWKKIARQLLEQVMRISLAFAGTFCKLHILL